MRDTNNLYFFDMRLHLQTTVNDGIIPFDYQKKLTGVIHKWMGSNNEEHGKISLYSFSWLRNTKKVENGVVCTKGSNLFISAYDNDLLRKICLNIRKTPDLFNGMRVCEIIIEDEPDLTKKELFYLGSPILIKRYFDKENIEYCFENPESGRMLEETLRNKMKLAGLPDDDTLHIEFDLSYKNKKTKLVWYNHISSKANMCPVIIKGSNVTKQFAWNVGLGNCTGVGFGSIY